MAAAAMFKAFPGTGRPTAPVVEFLKNTVFYTISTTDPTPKEGVVFFTVDTKLVYNAFYLDFGPHNLGSTFQFCAVMNKMVAAVKASAAATKHKRHIYFYSSSDPHMRANAVCLLASWGVLFLGMTPSQAFAPFAFMSFPPFHDASPTVCDFKLTILDCLYGIAKAVNNRLIDSSTFDLHEYHHYEQVDNGDLTWISPKLLAFAGPQNDYTLSAEGYVTLTPEHYVPYFKKKGVTLVVRLNEAMYDASRFTKAGIAHLDLFYPDGASPPEYLLNQFLEACKATSGAVAVHCKAGLGRTGTCIAAYIMKHHRFSAKEAIGWLRVCRPGSVIGPQQSYLESIQMRMWHLGETTANVRQRLDRYTERASSFGLTAPPVSTKSLGPGRLLTTRSINIFGSRRSVDLSVNLGVGVTATNFREHDSSRFKKTSQGDQLRRIKQQTIQG